MSSPGFEALGFDPDAGDGAVDASGPQRPWLWVAGFFAVLVVATTAAVLSVARPWLSGAERIQAFHVGCYDPSGELCDDDDAVLGLVEDGTGLGLPEGSQLLYSSSSRAGLHHRSSSAIIRVPAGAEVSFPDEYGAVEPESFGLDPEQPERLRSDEAVLLDSYGLERIVETRDSWSPDGPRKSSRVSIGELGTSDDRLLVITTFD